MQQPKNEESDPLVSIRNLSVEFSTEEGIVRAVEDMSFDVPRGKTLCIVGESGCGKSVTGRAIMRIIDPPGKIVSGKITYHPTPDETIDITALRPMSSQIRAIRGGEIGMIFQEPMVSLGPIQKIGKQISETIKIHTSCTKREAKERAIEILHKVGIPDPAKRYDAYPFQLSGGMRQRVMIALGLACSPKLLIADEPTTALDVTTQAAILDLIRELQDETGMAVMFVTHDLGVVAEIADQVAVVYLGRVVEEGDVHTIFNDPKHPYTKALLKSIPKIGGSREPLYSIKGMVPNPLNRPFGCPFYPRCEAFIPGQCDQEIPAPVQVGSNHTVRCLQYKEGGDQ
tara:strand:+ start:5717 stop:6742 length:1026 start_codon:yes stop_codon:yes gene_type:complete